MGFKIDQGTFGQVPLDGLGFIVVGYTPEEMGKGNWSVGVVVDERADAAQRQAILTIASGDAGGPMAALAGMITRFVGVESAPIRFDRDGVKWSVSAPDLVKISATPAMGLDPNAPGPLELRNTGHPANTNVTLDNAVHSHVDVFGFSWNDVSGRNNGQHAPFTWASA